MAIGHISVRAHSRKKGHSAAAAIAYRFGLALRCPRTGQRHDFSRRSQREDVAACGLTPGPFRTPAALVDAIENAERRHDAKVLRDVQIALPAELDDDDARTALAERFAGALAERYRTVTAWAVHRPDRRSDQRNHHAHIVLPTRALDKPRLRFAKKLRALDVLPSSRDEIKAIRALWEETANQALREAGSEARVHTGRTTDPAPTLGPTHTAIERRAWKKRHHGQTQPAMSAAWLVLDDGHCVTGRGRRLARYGMRRALLEHVLGRHAPRSVPVPEAAPAPVVAEEPLPDAHPDPKLWPAPLMLPRAPVVTLEPAPQARPDPEPCPMPLSLPKAPWAALEPIPRGIPDPDPRPRLLTPPRASVTALEPVPAVIPDPEPRPEPLTLPKAPLTALEPLPKADPAPEARPAPVAGPSAEEERALKAHAEFTQALAPSELEHVGALQIDTRAPDRIRKRLEGSFDPHTWLGASFDPHTWLGASFDPHTRRHILHELDVYTRRFSLRTVLSSVEHTLAEWRAWWRDGDRGRRIATEIRTRVWPTHWRETRMRLDGTDEQERERIRRELDDEAQRREQEGEEAQHQQAARAPPRPRGFTQR